MSDSPPILDSPEPENDSAGVGVVRQTVELLAMLCLGVLCFRAFAAEAYIVPTGSMAPTLLGRHLELTCPGCGFRFDVGMDEDARPSRLICPNCGQRDFDDGGAVRNGDRVLVQKLLYEFRPPRRWEVSVFQFPGDPSQAYVKRVVGLPGEAVQIVDGDVWINGRVARKELADARATRILTHDGRCAPADSSRNPRWGFRRGPALQLEPSGWSQDDEGGFHHEFVDYSGVDSDDWLIYRHWDPILERYGPIRDHYGYNGDNVDSDNVVKDIGLETRARIGPEVRELSIMLRSAGDRFVVRVPVGGDGSVRLTRNGASRLIEPRSNPLAVAAGEEREHVVEAYVFDQRVMAAIDGELLFEPFDYDDPTEPSSNDESPVALGVRGGALTASELKIFRDIHYTSSLGAIHRRPSGVAEPWELKGDEYFVLGDNSPVSNDSRFWTAGPVVPRSLFLGKPFLVHLPGRVVALEVFGRSVYWIPDPRQIRYIH